MIRETLLSHELIIDTTFIIRHQSQKIKSTIVEILIKSFYVPNLIRKIHCFF